MKRKKRTETAETTTTKDETLSDRLTDIREGDTPEVMNLRGNPFIMLNAVVIGMEMVDDSARFAVEFVHGYGLTEDAQAAAVEAVWHAANNWLAREAKGKTLLGEAAALQQAIDEARQGHVSHGS